MQIFEQLAVQADIWESSMSIGPKPGPTANNADGATSLVQSFYRSKPFKCIYPGTKYGHLSGFFLVLFWTKFSYLKLQPNTFGATYFSLR